MLKAEKAAQRQWQIFRPVHVGGWQDVAVTNGGHRCERPMQGHAVLCFPVGHREALLPDPRVTGILICGASLQRFDLPAGLEGRVQS